MKKTFTIAAIIFVVIILGLYFVNKNQKNITSQPIKIGVILPLTGPAQSAGEAGRKSVELAISNLPENIRKNIQIVYEDDQSDTKLTVTAAQKLIEVDKVKSLIT